VTPPLTISYAEIDLAVEILAQAVEEADAVSDEEVSPYAGW
jgi:hypothetical protein